MSADSPAAWGLPNKVSMLDAAALPEVCVEENAPSASVKAFTSFISDPSLNDGLGAIPAARKPIAGTRPSGLGFIQMVPPVMMMRTVDSEAISAV